MFDNIYKRDEYTDSLTLYDGAVTNAPAVLAHFAQKTGTDHFDVVAERLTLRDDWRLKRKEKQSGEPIYYLWFRSPFTRFRGFWGTLLITYWPLYFLIMFFETLHSMAAVNGGAGGLFGDNFVELLEPTVDARYGFFTLMVILGFFVSLFWVRAWGRYFFIATTTRRRYRFGIYAHCFVMLSFAWLLCMLSFFSITTGDGTYFDISYFDISYLGGAWRLITNPESWKELVLAVQMLAKPALDTAINLPWYTAQKILLPAREFFSVNFKYLFPGMLIVVWLFDEIKSFALTGMAHQGLPIIRAKLQQEGLLHGGLLKQYEVRHAAAWESFSSWGVMWVWGMMYIGLTLVLVGVLFYLNGWLF